MAENFNPHCPCCAEELVTGSYSVPADPLDDGHRHPSSDPKESLRKELTQCQFCFKSRGADVTLRKCAACLIDIYCSKECQRKAWPSHKIKCKLNQRLKDSPSKDRYEALRAFTSKHRPIIADSAVNALNLSVDPSCATRDILCIFVKPRPGSSRVETSFYAASASVVPANSINAEIAGQLKLVNEQYKGMGQLGAVFAVLMCTEPGKQTIVNVAPVGFSRDVFELKPGKPWKERLLKHLNQGIVN